MTDWRHHAACRDDDPERYFPVGSGPGAERQTASAKTVCASCPVIAECLNWALQAGLDHGVFGGLSKDERRALRRHHLTTTEAA